MQCQAEHAAQCAKEATGATAGATADAAGAATHVAGAAADSAQQQLHRATETVQQVIMLMLLYRCICLMISLILWCLVMHLIPFHPVLRRAVPRLLGRWRRQPRARWRPSRTP